MLANKEARLISLLAIIFAGIAFFLFGVTNLDLSSKDIAKIEVTPGHVICHQNLIGSTCTARDTSRGGGGMCFYSNVTFYTLNPKQFTDSWRGELYAPLTTCDTSVKILTPVIDVALATTLSIICTIGGALIAAAGITKLRSTQIIGSQRLV